MSKNRCPVCHADIPKPFGESLVGDLVQIDCPNCGSHRLTGSALSMLQLAVDRPSTAHAVFKLPAGSVVTTDFLRAVGAKGAALPPAGERIDNLVLHLGQRFQPGDTVKMSPANLTAAVGAQTAIAALWVITEARRRGLVDAEDIGHLDELVRTHKVTLTAAGWARHDELLRKGTGSRHAFLAMKFNVPELDSVFRDYLQPAAKDAGYDLRPSNHDGQPAGSIDDSMRVEIRTSRFVVCDLTHGNQGAYWEAGFAEGIGRPVIYICRADVLALPGDKGGPHFDTRNQKIIPWDLGSLEPFRRQLTNTIRATLPEEAKMADDE